VKLETTEALIGAVGRENVLERAAAAEYAVVDRAPRFALFPHTLEAACAAMAAAHAR